MSVRCERVFLGWDAPMLERAAALLIERFRERGRVDLSRAVVVLPGRRAARRLEELLAARAGPDWVPPIFCTEAVLAHALSSEVLPVAPSLANELLWADAIRALAPERRLAVFARAPAGDGPRTWLAWGRAVAELDAQIASEAADFARIAATHEGRGSAREAARWAALAAAEGHRRKRLASCGWIDPARVDAWVADRSLARADARVVLVSLTDLASAPRQLLAKLAEPPLALVFAPESEASGFDELGALIPAAWRERDVPLADDAWDVAANPRELAKLTADWIAAGATGAPASEFALGVLEPDSGLALERELGERGVAMRRSAGEPASESELARFFAASRDFLEARSFASLAALVRQPAVEAALGATAGLSGVDVPGELDAHFAEHLPARADGRWAAKTDVARKLDAVRDSVRALLGELDAGSARPLSQWADAIAACAARAFVSVELAPLDPSAWRESRAVEALAEVLGELRALAATPADVDATAADALGVVLDVLEQRTLPALPAPDAVEALGWLELALDDAPRLYLAGLNEGFVPGPSHGDPFLPDALRAELGLRDERRRVARDVHALTAILRSRRDVRAASLRAGADGEPLAPSRLVFHANEAALLARVDRFFGEPEPPAAARGSGSDSAAARPRPTPFVPSKLAVSWFKAYLASPYRFYLECALRLKSVRDEASELDPLLFGSLAHDVLERFGSSDARDSADAREVAEALQRALERVCAERFAANSPPAVELQIRSLERRLRAFAQPQAARAAAGWRIAEVECSLERELDVDGEPVLLRGRIDRLDRHAPSGAWCAIDYKSSEEALEPGKAHRTEQRGWFDLQLPLYAYLLEPKLGIPAPELAYANLPRKLADTGFASAAWKSGELAAALEVAREVVRKMRRGEFDDVGRRKPRERIVAALCGTSLLALPGPDENGATDNGASGGSAEDDA